MTARRAFLVAALLAPFTACSLWKALTRSEWASYPASELEVVEAEHRVVVQEEGLDALAARVRLIRGARHEIRLQTFIFENDSVGRLLAFELLAAARRGVRVHLLVDQMFSVQDAKLIAALASADAHFEIRHYNPVANRIRPVLGQQLAALLVDFRGFNHRMHNKVLTVDGKYVVTGGRNVQDAYFSYATGLNYHDRDVLVEGPIAKKVEAAFDRYWNNPLAVKSEDLIDVGEAMREKTFEAIGDEHTFRIDEVLAALASRLTDASGAPLPDESSFAKAIPVHRLAFVVDEPGKNSGTRLDQGGAATRHCRQLLAGATREILAQTPYLVLTDRAFDLLADLRRDHPEIRIRASTNSLSATDAWYAYAGHYRQKRRLIEEGAVEVCEWKPLPGDLASFVPDYAALRERRANENGVDPSALPPIGDAAGLGREPYLCLHAKAFVVDRAIAMVGSFNVDPRSTNLNTESMMVFFDPVVAARVADSIERDMAPRNSWVIWRRERPPVVEDVMSLVEGVNAFGVSITGVDVWPSTATSAFELNDGASAVNVSDPRFHEHFREVGNFPWVPASDPRLVLAQLFAAALAEPASPIL